MKPKKDIPIYDIALKLDLSSAARKYRKLQNNWVTGIILLPAELIVRKSSLKKYRFETFYFK